MKTYKEWMVEKYLGKDTPRGDLAYDLKRDKEFPEGHINRERILDYLSFRGACNSAVKYFKRTWNDYCKETGYQNS